MNIVGFGMICVLVYQVVLGIQVLYILEVGVVFVFLGFFVLGFYKLSLGMQFLVFSDIGLIQGEFRRVWVRMVLFLEKVKDVKLILVLRVFEI